MAGLLGGARRIGDGCRLQLEETSRCLEEQGAAWDWVPAAAWGKIAQGGVFAKGGDALRREARAWGLRAWGPHARAMNIPSWGLRAWGPLWAGGCGTGAGGAMEGGGLIVRSEQMEVDHRASCAVPEELLASLVRPVALDTVVAAGKTLLWLLLAADQSVEPSLTFYKLPNVSDGKLKVATTGKKSQVIPENKDVGESDDDEDEDEDDDGDDQDDDGGEEYSGDEGKENEGEEDDDDDPEANGAGGSDDEDDDDDDDEDDDDDDEDEDEDEDEEDEELEQPPSKKRK